MLANILNYEYLWSEIRVQGGAYGCGFAGTEDGEIFFSTYRDPQPGRSLGVFDGAAGFIRSLCGENPDLTRFILGSVSELDPLLNAEQQIAAAERMYFLGGTQAERRRRYSELLNTGCSDLLELCAMLDELTDDRQICVVAGQAQLDACGGQLDEILRG